MYLSIFDAFHRGSDGIWRFPPGVILRIKWLLRSASSGEYGPGNRARGRRITVWDVLSWRAGGMSEKEILDDYPELEPDDFPAIYDFAAHMGGRVAL